MSLNRNIIPENLVLIYKIMLIFTNETSLTSDSFEKTFVIILESLIDMEMGCHSTI